MIQEVWFYDQADLAIENLAYWFTDCVNLTMAEVPYTTKMIGEGAFAGCSSLVRLMLYYSSGEDFTIDPGAFRVDEVVETAICYPSQNESVGLALAGYDWEAENRTASCTTSTELCRCSTAMRAAAHTKATTSTRSGWTPAGTISTASGAASISVNI